MTANELEDIQRQAKQEYLIEQRSVQLELEQTKQTLLKERKEKEAALAEIERLKKELLGKTSFFTQEEHQYREHCDREEYFRINNVKMEQEIATRNLLVEQQEKEAAQQREIVVLEETKSIIQETQEAFVEIERLNILIKQKKH